MSEDETPDGTETSIGRRDYMRLIGGAAGVAAAGLPAVGTAAAATDPNDPGILEPVRTKLSGSAVRIPNTDQVKDGELHQVVSHTVEDADGATSVRGHEITRVSDPHDDLRAALEELSKAAEDGDTAAMDNAAGEVEAILTGETAGRIYDGFRLLNYSQGGPLDDQVDGEYKMKRLRDSGETRTSIDGTQHTVWEVDVNMLWYGESFDADTFLLRVPVDAHPHDLLRVNYHVYSLEREELSPGTAVNDAAGLPFKIFDSTWSEVHTDEVAHVSVNKPPLGLLRGIYTWGWRDHPPKIQFLQPVFETEIDGEVVLDSPSKSFTVRNRNLSIDDIGDAAPEKKAHTVARAVLDDTADPSEVNAMLTDPGTDPRGTADEWVDLMTDPLQLPPEAWDVLESEGIDRGTFGPYSYVTVYANNEMYGDGPDGADTMEPWSQGDQFEVKVINLDDHTHYYRAVDFGYRVGDDIRTAPDSLDLSGASHSFEIMNFKPLYGGPKSAEMQWRSGWGFRPHKDVIRQYDVFPRSTDREILESLTDGGGDAHAGYRFSTTDGTNTWRFDPPKEIIGTADDPSAEKLHESDGTEGLLMGRRTEQFGVAKMPTGDLSGVHPRGLTNMDVDGDGDEELVFPKFLRNPDDAGGDIIPPTPLWKPFWYLSPENGTLYRNGTDGSDGYWIDETYAQGAPVKGNGDVTTTIEGARASGFVFYQFDPLFHDNAIMSPHPE
ncbi:hypothetical protein [Halobaculum gomorrense]|uniref:Uncharacterized protein n=1 Tax=Halobaculum gomorrense TaxID=43928 RepID=A0A1M5JNH7_9EURY|nr:hypothetical protein [Halobaculum gomorrense]SHG42117.1 hypothetical protein SAMN05443636_0198 [Halobaculum gomorrense]